MVVRPEAPPLTVEHYKNLPETGPRYQLVEGDLYVAPTPNRYHQDISRNLEFILLRYLKERPIGVLYHAPFDVYLSETDVFQPDIVIDLNANLDRLTDAGCEGPPDFIIEILSPKTPTGSRKQNAGLRPIWSERALDHRSGAAGSSCLPIWRKDLAKMSASLQSVFTKAILALVRSSRIWR